MSAQPYPKEQLAHWVKQAVAEDDFVLVSETEIGIVLYDNQKDKDTSIFFVPRSKVDLQEAVFIGEDAQSFLWTDPRTLTGTISDVLSQTDPNMLITLQKIIVAASDTDMRKACDLLNLPYDYIPEAVWFDDDESALGCLWYLANSVVVNIKGIAQIVKEIWTDSEYYQNKELEIGFWTTLLHELRHLMMDTNPFLPEDDYPINLAAECAVEDFCREEAERLGLVS